MNVYIENHETSTNLPCDEQLDDWIIKDQQILVSNKKDAILDQIPSTSQYDDAFNGYYVFEFVETEAIARERSVKSFLKSLAKFTGKHLANLLKKKTLAQVLSCEVCKFFKNSYFYRTPPVAPSFQTDAKKSTGNKNSNKEPLVADQQRNKKRNFNTPEAGNECNQF